MDCRQLWGRSSRRSTAESVGNLRNAGPFFGSPPDEAHFDFAVTARTASINQGQEFAPFARDTRGHGEMFEKRIEARVNSYAVSDLSGLHAESGTSGPSCD
jgi:hypothetical protein